MLCVERKNGSFIGMTEVMIPESVIAPWKTGLKNKNDYLYIIQIVLADIKGKSYNLMIKRIPSGQRLKYKKNVMFLFLYHIFSLHVPEGIKQ